MSGSRARWGSGLAAGGAGVVALTLVGGALVLTEASWRDTQRTYAEITAGEWDDGADPTPSPTDPPGEPGLPGDGPITEEDIEQLLEEMSEEELVEFLRGEDSLDDERIARVSEREGLEPVTGDQEIVVDVGDPVFAGRSLDFCYDVEILNDGEEDAWWELTFDTSQPPYWGWEPHNGEQNYVEPNNPWLGFYETADWTPHSDGRPGGLWTIRGTEDETGWGRRTDGWRSDHEAPIPPGDAVTIELCPRHMPSPAVDYTLFTYDVWDAQPDNNYYSQLQVTAQTAVETRLPWEVYVSLRPFYCEPTIEWLQEDPSRLTTPQGVPWEQVSDSTLYRVALPLGHHNGVIQAGQDSGSQIILQVNAELQRQGTHC